MRTWETTVSWGRKVSSQKSVIPSEKYVRQHLRVHSGFTSAPYYQRVRPNCAWKIDQWLLMQTLRQADCQDRLPVLLFLLPNLTGGRNNTNNNGYMCIFVNAFWKYKARQTARCSVCDCFFKVSGNGLTWRWKQFPVMFCHKIDLLQKFRAIFLGSSEAICLILPAEKHVSLFPCCLKNITHKS